MPASEKPVKCPRCGTVAHKRRRVPGYNCRRCYCEFLVPAANVTTVSRGHMQWEGV
jgi:ribosomal protein L37AE/L43A